MWMFNENTVFHIIAGIGVLHLWSFGWKPSSTYDSGKKNDSLSYILNKGGSCSSLETRLDYLLILCAKSYLTLLISSWVSRQAFGTIEILTDALAQLHESKLKPQTLWHHNLSMTTFSIHWYLRGGVGLCLSCSSWLCLLMNIMLSFQGYRYWGGVGVPQSCESALTHYRLVANHGKLCYISVLHQLQSSYTSKYV